MIGSQVSQIAILHCPMLLLLLLLLLLFKSP